MTAKGHPVAPPSGVVARARVVLYDEIGPGPHPCHWCEKQIDWMPGNPHSPEALVVDHINWDATDDSPVNLAPSCNPCNSHRRAHGKSAPIQEGELAVMWSGRMVRAVERTCVACRKEFLIPESATKRGRGRYCSRWCAGTSSTPPGG